MKATYFVVCVMLLTALIQGCGSQVDFASHRSEAPDDESEEEVGFNIVDEADAEEAFSDSVCGAKLTHYRTAVNGTVIEFLANRIDASFVMDKGTAAGFIPGAAYCIVDDNRGSIVCGTIETAAAETSSDVLFSSFTNRTAEYATWEAWQNYIRSLSPTNNIQEITTYIGDNVSVHLKQKLTSRPAECAYPTELFPAAPTPPPPSVPFPAAPGSLKTSKVTKKLVTLKWTDNSKDEKGFRVLRADTSGTFTVLKSLAKNKKSFSDKKVTRGATYKYVVEVFNANGSTRSNEIFVVIP